ncbi:MAG: hypothetical protein ACOCXJ_01290 [Planctomycetota bacterium]
MGSGASSLQAADARINDDDQIEWTSNWPNAEAGADCYDVDDHYDASQPYRFDDDDYATVEYEYDTDYVYDENAYDYGYGQYESGSDWDGYGDWNPFGIEDD